MGKGKSFLIRRATVEDAVALRALRLEALQNNPIASHADNAMSGPAQVTYVESYELGGETCKISWTTDNIVRSPDLSGTIQKNQDGSLTIGLLAYPKEGLSFSEDYLCLGEIPTTPTFPGTGEVLVNGKYDQRHDFTVGPDITGTTYETVHMEIVP